MKVSVRYLEVLSNGFIIWERVEFHLMQVLLNHCLRIGIIPMKRIKKMKALRPWHEEEIDKASLEFPRGHLQRLICANEEDLG